APEGSPWRCPEACPGLGGDGLGARGDLLLQQPAGKLEGARDGGEVSLPGGQSRPGEGCSSDPAGLDGGGNLRPGLPTGPERAPLLPGGADLPALPGSAQGDRKSGG